MTVEEETMSHGVQAASTSWKGEEKDASLKPQKEHRPPVNLLLVHGDLFWTSEEMEFSG